MRPLRAAHGRRTVNVLPAPGSLRTVHGAAVRAGDQVDDAQAEADAGGLARQPLIDAVEAPEDAPLLARGDADAVVLHGERDDHPPSRDARTTMRLSSGVYFSALSSRLMSAVTSASRIGAHRRQVRRDLHR